MIHVNISFYQLHETNHPVVESPLKLYFERFEDTSKVRFSLSYALDEIDGSVTNAQD